MVCFPCDQEIWSAASHEVTCFVIAQCCWRRPNCISPLMIDGIKNVECRNYRSDSHLRIGEGNYGCARFATKRCSESRASFTTLLERIEVSFSYHILGRKYYRPGTPGQAQGDCRGCRGTPHRGVRRRFAIEPSPRQGILIVDHIIKVADGLVFRIVAGILNVAF